MAIQDSTQHETLLGRTVVLTRWDAGFEFEHTGRVIAVVQALPGSRATPSILLEEDDRRCDFFDLEEITIQAVL